MEAKNYVGAPMDIQDKEPLLKGTDVERIGDRTIIRFSAEMYLGNTTDDIDWQRLQFSRAGYPVGNGMGNQRLMWATGTTSGQGSNATVGFHGPNRAISPLGFPGAHKARSCEEETERDDTYLSVV